MEYVFLSERYDIVYASVVELDLEEVKQKGSDVSIPHKVFYTRLRRSVNLIALKFG